MKITRNSVFENTTMMMRDAYADSIAAIMEQDPRVVALDADLASCINMNKVMEKYPNQSINCGIAEANMVCIAAGLATTGKVPFAHSFAVFTSRRACDQIFMSVCYGGTNVRLIGSDPGVAAAFNGGTHMPFADMGILRTMPNITLLEPTDYAMTEDLVRQLRNGNGAYYLRLYRKNLPHIYERGSSFEIGKAVTLCQGKDVTIISSGIMVAEALVAAEQLKAEGIEARVLDMFTWKPLDKQAVIEAAQETGCIVTAENHSVVAGLGSAVAETLATSLPVPQEMVGVQDEFGEVGPEAWLKERFGLTSAGIISAVHRVIARKMTR